MDRKDFCFDIDGTLANIEHRRQYVASKPKNWKAFNASMHLDTPHDDIVFLAKLFKQLGHRIILCSGRGEEQRKVTEKWLKDHDIQYDALYMRKEQDYRSDNIVKSELLDQLLLDGYSPFMVFDDRDQVVDMWRKRGIRCCQVAPGDF